MNNQNYSQNQNQNQNQNQGTQVIDKGRIVVGVEKYPVKENGQLVMIPGTQTPKTKNKWMAVGEATKFRHSDGSISESRKIYLQPVVVMNNFFEEKTFWDSESQQNAGQQPQQTGGFNQQQAPQQGGFRQG
jgi:hypothetical protein